MTGPGVAARLEVHEEFPLRPGLAVRIFNRLKGRREVAGEIGVLHVFYRDADDPAPPAEVVVEVFAALLHALDPRPARVVADRYLRAFGDRARATGHEVEQRGGTSSYLTTGAVEDLRWTLEEFDHEPPSILCGEAPGHPDAPALHLLAGLLPDLAFLAEPALFREQLSLYYHTRGRGDALAAAIARYCETRGLDLFAPGRG